MTVPFIQSWPHSGHLVRLWRRDDWIPSLHLSLTSCVGGDEPFDSNLCVLSMACLLLETVTGMAVENIRQRHTVKVGRSLGLCQ